MAPDRPPVRPPALPGLALAGLLLAVTASCLHAADVLYYGVAKLRQYTQAGDAPPVSPATNGFAFAALVVGATNHAVTAATVRPPGSLPALTLLSVTNGLAHLHEESFDTAAALDAAYPSRGSLFNPSVYTFTIDTAREGRRQAGVSYLGALAFPGAARLRNPGAALGIDPAADFILRWEVPGGSFLEVVQIAVTDAATNLVFASPLPLTPDALNGLSTEIRIPAYTLPPDADLQGHVAVLRTGLPDTDAIPGATGVAALVSDTAFSLRTRPAPAAPRLEVFPVDGAAVGLRFHCETNRSLHLQGSTNLVDWGDLLVTNTTATTGEFREVTAPPPARRFYRLQIGP